MQLNHNESMPFMQQAGLISHHSDHIIIISCFIHN